MSKPITEWIKEELYPTLYQSIDIAFPELDFKKYAGGWRSALKLDLSNPKERRPDKTVVHKQSSGFIFEQGGEHISLVDYVIRRDGVDFLQAVQNLAAVARLQLPKGDFDQDSYQRYKDRATLLEACNSYFIYCLQKATGSDEARAYLSSRGYSEQDIQAMELGYIPSQSKLIEYLKGKGYSQGLIDETVKLHTAIGSTHKLTIPYRSGGSLKGFKFRTTANHSPKYYNSTGLDRQGGFFNLLGIKGDKDVVIVEGELDSLSATARGIENVVATTGNAVTQEQVRDAIKRGAKSFTLCFDTEPDKQQETVKNVNSVIQIILAEGVSRVYIVTLPDLGQGKTDPDRLIKEQGVEAFKQAIQEALPYYEYKLQDTLYRYGTLQNEKGKLDPRDIDSLLEEVVETASKISDPVDRDRYKSLFTSLEPIQELGVTKQSLDITVDRLTSSKEKEAQDEQLRKLIVQTIGLQDKGQTEKALELLEGRVKEVKTMAARELLPPPMSYSNLIDAMATLPPAYRTGYSSLDSFVGFTAGAITLIAGRPSHGKTTFMFNLLLQMSKAYEQETFYFFTYEEPVKNISVKLLNRLIGTDLSSYFGQVPDLSKPTNYEFIKDYIRAGRTDIPSVEEGKRLFKELIDSQRIKVIDRNYSVEELSSLIAYLNNKERIGAVFIDYIQRMNTQRRTQDKRTEIAHISDQVLQIAKDSSLPIILGAQLNRDATNAKEPRLENLKEAGNLEEDANTVLSVYCKAREQEEDEATGQQNSRRREVELKIKALKNREGEVNTHQTLNFDRYTGVISDPPPPSILSVKDIRRNAK
jgi:DNA primase catalytic core